MFHFSMEPLNNPITSIVAEHTSDSTEPTCKTLAQGLPVTSWHETIGDPTQADALLDRIVHNAHKIELKAVDTCGVVHRSLKANYEFFRDDHSEEHGSGYNKCPGQNLYFYIVEFSHKCVTINTLAWDN